MVEFERCPSCRGRGNRPIIRPKDVTHTWWEFMWRFPFIRLVTEEFKGVLTYEGDRVCEKCAGWGEIPIGGIASDENKDKTLH